MLNVLNVDNKEAGMPLLLRESGVWVETLADDKADGERGLGGMVSG